MEKEKLAVETLKAEVEGLWATHHENPVNKPKEEGKEKEGKQKVKKLVYLQPTMDFATTIYSAGPQRENLLKLAETFPKVVRISDDGNCLFRSLIAGSLAYHTQSRHVQKNESIGKIMEAVQAKYGTDELFKKASALIGKLTENAELFGWEYLEGILNEQGPSDAIVQLFRYIVTDSMLSESFVFFLGEDDAGPNGIPFSRKMNMWGGAAEIARFAKIFDLKVRVWDVFERTDSVYGESTEPIIELIFKGAHYDLFNKYLP